MEQPENVINRKVKMTEVRNEIKGIKENLFKKTAVMRGDDLRAYLDHLRYAENMIRARDAQGKGEATMERPREKHIERKKENTENSTEEEPVKKVKNVEKKVKSEIKEIKKEMKKEKKASPKKKEKLHKAEAGHLDKIPKELHKLYNKHLKYHDNDHKKAHKAFKTEINKMK
jgi:SOS response regulatory protein OraA/RecX